MSEEKLASTIDEYRELEGVADLASTQFWSLCKSVWDKWGSLPADARQNALVIISAGLADAIGRNWPGVVQAATNLATLLAPYVLA